MHSLEIQSFTNAIFISGVLLFIGVIVTKPSRRYGIPALLLYIGLGFFIGNGGKYDFLFNYPKYVSLYSQFAIGFIVFIGGLLTPLHRIKPIWKEGVLLSTLGVLWTATMIALFANWFLGISIASGLLLGSVLAATDAAAVFSILESKKLKLKENITETLEFESATNDPMAYFLTIALTGFVATNRAIDGQLLVSFLRETGLAIIIGGGVSYLLVYLLKYIKLEIEGLYPIIILSCMLIILGLSPIVHANPLLALFIAGIVIGNGSPEAKTHSLVFFSGFSWLMEISLFVVIGLQANPARSLSSIGPALAVTACLILVARPLAVFTVYSLFQSSFKKRVFVSWVGLRGATPIAFALIPLTNNLALGSFIFDVAFLVVIFSTIIQGTTLEWLAKKLDLITK